MKSTVKTHCKMCNCRCGIIVTVEDGKIISFKGDPDCRKNDGKICVRGRAMLELQYDPDRLMFPEKKTPDGFQRISWDSAYSEIAEKLSDLKSRYGAESLAVYRGMSVYSWLVSVQLQRFMNLFGTPNYASNSALCVSSKVFSTKYSFGPGVSTCGDFRSSKCILLLGTNPAVTGMHRSLRVMRDINYARKNGAVLIVVDPKKTETAALADIHTTIRPGTDTAFILSMVHVIIKNGWYDKDFIDKHTTGFNELKKITEAYEPREVEKICWIPAEQIINIAEIFAKTKSACADRREGVIHHEHGMQTCRAVDILNTITGNIDVEGGVHLQTKMFSPVSPAFKRLTYPEMLTNTRPSVSADNKITRDVPSNLIRAILEEKPYPIKALIVIGSNPVLAWPNSSVVQEALKKLDLLVMLDLYRNDTATFSHYNLPVATFFEKVDFQSPEVAIPRILQYQPKLIEPAGEAKPDFQIIKELSGKLGFGEYFPESEDEILENMLGDWGLSIDELKSRNDGSGFEFEPRPVGYFRKNGFPDKNGKINLASEDLAKAGAISLPEYREPSESPVSDSETCKKYPLILISGNRLSASYLSASHNLPSLHDKVSENWVEMHSQTAAERDISDGEIVFVESLRGKIQIKAKLNDKVDPRVVMIPYGWGHSFGGSWQIANSTPGANVNILTDHNRIDKTSGMPAYKDSLCEVYNIDKTD